MNVATVNVREIMRSDPVTVGAEATVRDLIRVLADHSIGGVPVIDRTEKVVGVVSAADVLRLIPEWERQTGTAETDSGAAAVAGETEIGEAGEETGRFFHEPEGPLFQLPESLPPRIPATLLDRTRVRQIMTPATFSVRPEASVPELARFLLGAGIHRALVFEGSEMVGIVTSVDVLRAVAGEA